MPTFWIFWSSASSSESISDSDPYPAAKHWTSEFFRTWLAVLSALDFCWRIGISDHILKLSTLNPFQQYKEPVISSPSLYSKSLDSSATSELQNCRFSFFYFNLLLAFFETHGQCVLNQEFQWENSELLLLSRPAETTSFPLDSIYRNKTSEPAEVPSPFASLTTN